MDASNNESSVFDNIGFKDLLVRLPYVESEYVTWAPVLTHVCLCNWSLMLSANLETKASNLSLSAGGQRTKLWISVQGLYILEGFTGKNAVQHRGEKVPWPGDLTL